MLRVAVSFPLFVNVTVCAALVVPTFCGENVRLVADACVYGVSCPVPITEITVGLSLALELTVTVPVRVPMTAGWKSNKVAHEPPAGMVPAQASVADNIPAGEPKMEEIVTGVALRLRISTT